MDSLEKTWLIGLIIVGILVMGTVAIGLNYAATHERNSIVELVKAGAGPIEAKCAIGICNDAIRAMLVLEGAR